MDRSFDDRNAAARARMRALVARLTDEDLTRSLPGGWTVAATLAHIAFWDRRACVLLDRWARDGVSPSPVDVDAINDALLPQWLLIPPRVAAQDALIAAEEVDAKVAALTNELLAAIDEGVTLRLDRSHHRRAHLDELERLFP